MKQLSRSALGLLLSLTAGFALAGGCQKAAPPEPAPSPPKAAAPPPEPVAAPPETPPQPAPPAARPLEWDDPPQWKNKGQNGMRLVSYEVPAAKGDKEGGELNVFVLGGDVDANIQRWIDEFSGMSLKSVVRNDRTVNGMRQAVVEVPKGKFSGGMSEKGARDDYGLLGAIVVAPSGAEYFFKLTGPSATVKAARASFYGLLDGIREQGGTPEKPAASQAKAGGKSTKSAGKP